MHATGEKAGGKAKSHQYGIFFKARGKNGGQKGEGDYARWPEIDRRQG